MKNMYQSKLTFPKLRRSTLLEDWGCCTGGCCTGGVLTAGGGGVGSSRDRRSTKDDSAGFASTTGAGAGCAGGACSAVWNEWNNTSEEYVFIVCWMY